jgi:Fe2+ transport system protein FeoA
MLSQPVIDQAHLPRAIMNDQTLQQAPIGPWMRIILVNDARLGAKLSQLGLLPGSRIRVLRAAPLGGPVLVEVNGRSIALGRRIASRIRVEVSGCDSP